MSTDSSCTSSSTYALQLHQALHGTCRKMKDKTDDKLQLHQTFHGSFKLHPSRLLSHPYISPAHADHHNRDDHNEYLVDSADHLQPHVQAFHLRSSTHHDGAAAPHCGPLLDQAYFALDNHSRRDDQDDAAAFRNDHKLGQISDDHLLQAFHGSFDHRDVAAAPQYCGLLTQSLSAQLARSSTKDDQDAAAAGDDDHTRCNTRRWQPRCNILRQQASSTEADHIKCEDKKHSHADDKLHEADHGNSMKQYSDAEDGTVRQRRSSLAEAFSTEDYKDLLILLSQSSSTKSAFSYNSSSALVSEEISHSKKVKFSSCRFNTMKSCPLMQSSSFSTRDDYTKKPYNLHEYKYNSKEPYHNNYKICSSSNYKYPMKEQYNNSYIMRGVGLAFKWRPNIISSFKLRSLLGGHLNKASSARVWVQEDEISSNMNAKLSSHTPLHYEKPSNNYTSTSYQKSINGDCIISEKSATCSFTNGKSPKYSPSNSCINGIISTRNSPTSSGHSSCSFITKFGSNLGNTSGSLSSYSSKDSHYNISSSSFNYNNHSSKLAGIKMPSLQEPKLKRLQSLFHGKNLNVQLLLGKSNGQQSNKVNCRNPSFIDRNCNVSSFHEELPKDSIQGAIAHCKQSNMATINNSNG